MKPINRTTMTLGAVVATLAGMSGSAQANPFNAEPLSSGYGVVAPQGNCGADNDKVTDKKMKNDGKCGADKAKDRVADKDKMTDQKIKKDGSCGADKAKSMVDDKDKMADQKMKKDGNCGADKHKAEHKDDM